MLMVVTMGGCGPLCPWQWPAASVWWPRPRVGLSTSHPESGFVGRGAGA